MLHVDIHLKETGKFIYFNRSTQHIIISYNLLTVSDDRKIYHYLNY